MAQFKFNGDWKFQYNLPAFDGFQVTRHDSYDAFTGKTGDGSMTVFFADDHSQSPDPSPEQLRAFEVLVEKQYEIVQSMFDEFERLMKDWWWSEFYEGREDEYEGKYFPEPDKLSIEGFKKLVGISMIGITIENEGGLSYTCISGNCEWDEEHGFGVKFHGTKRIAFGSAEEAFTDEHDGPEDDKSLELIVAHPKYGKLKPCQVENNKAYFYDCIAKGKVDMVKDYAEKMNFDFNAEKPYESPAELVSAIRNDQPEMVKFLLSKGQRLKKAHNGYHDIGNTFSSETIRPVMELMSDEQRSEFLQASMRNNIGGFINRYYIENNPGKIEERTWANVKPQSSSFFMERIKFINELGNGNPLTQELIDEVSNQFFRSRQVSSNDEFEKLLYPLLKEKPKKSGGSFYESPADRFERAKNQMLRAIEYYVISSQYVLMNNQMPKIGSPSKWKENIELVNKEFKDEILTRALIHEGIENIRKKVGQLSPDHLFTDGLYPLTKAYKDNMRQSPQTSSSPTQPQEPTFQLQEGFLKRVLDFFRGKRGN